MYKNPIVIILPITGINETKEPKSDIINPATAITNVIMNKFNNPICLAIFHILPICNDWLILFVLASVPRNTGINNEMINITT